MTWTDILGPERIAKGLFWTHPLSLVSGCTPVSSGCAHCWLRDMACRFSRNYPEGIVDSQGRWTGKVVTHRERLEKIPRRGHPRVYAIWSDLLHEKVPLEFFQDAYVMMMESERLNLGHIFLLITKRPEYGIKIIRPKRPLSNLYLLITVESQAQADERLPLALQIPAAKRGILYEPALGPVDFRPWLHKEDCRSIPGLDCLETEIDDVQGCVCPKDCIGHKQVYIDGEYDLNKPETCISYPATFDFIIAGPETGPRRRPAQTEWFLSARKQARNASIPYFQKALEVNGKISKNLADYPPELRVRELAY